MVIYCRNTSALATLLKRWGTVHLKKRMAAQLSMNSLFKHKALKLRDHIQVSALDFAKTGNTRSNISQAKFYLNLIYTSCYVTFLLLLPYSKKQGMSDIVA
jgi:hypothetical protein